MRALEKKDLRREARQRRKAMTAEVRAAASALACERLVEQLRWSGNGPVALFHTKGDEVDTSRAIAAVARSGVSVLLPRVVAVDRPLVFHAYRPGDPLLPSKFGVLEPAPIAPRLRPHIVVVPLLAFDDHGFRLGYGAAFYDMTLRELRRSGPIEAIGFGFACQQVPEVPREDHDQRVDLVVTDLGVLRPLPLQTG